jgi:hypothetical protein
MRINNQSLKKPKAWQGLPAFLVKGCGIINPLVRAAKHAMPPNAFL